MKTKVTRDIFKKMLLVSVRCMVCINHLATIFTGVWELGNTYLSGFHVGGYDVHTIIAAVVVTGNFLVPYSM